MMTILFIFCFINSLLIWIGFYRSSITLFIITLIFGVALFQSHITSHLSIQL